MNDFDADLMPTFTWTDGLVIAAAIAVAIAGAIILTIKSGLCAG